MLYPPLPQQRKRSPPSRSIVISVTVQVEVVVEVVEDLEEVHPQGMATPVEILATVTATVLAMGMIGVFATRTVVGAATVWMELISDGGQGTTKSIQYIRRMLGANNVSTLMHVS